MIRKAAIRQDGKVYTGKTYNHISTRIYDMTHKLTGEHGFVDSNGNFIDSQSAALIAYNAGQIKRKKKYLKEGDILLE